MEIYKYRQTLQEITTSLETAKEGLKPPKLQSELKSLENEQASENFWSNKERAKMVNKRASNIKRILYDLMIIETRLADLIELIDLIEEETEDSPFEFTALLNTLKEDVDNLFLETLLTGKYDEYNAILTLQAGAGGTEAQDWVEMLFRMYTRYSENMGYTLSLLDYQEGDDAGIKSVTFLLSGINAYGFLKAEKGVHRLVRISPFDAGKRRHTSFASLEVMPEITLDDSEIILKPEEIRIDTCRSSGAGGQHVNKTESAIRITHLPTGIVTWCQNQRSQTQNKDTAMKMLISKLTELKERELEQEQAKIKGDIKKIEWGSQIRSYVFCPYTMVKDHRTGYETPDVEGVMDGNIEKFIYEYLAKTG